MKKLLILAAAMTALGSFGASAQDIGVRIGPDGVRIGTERDRPRERVIIRERDRRDSRRAYRERRGRDCEVVTRTRINRNGDRVTTRERRC